MGHLATGGVLAIHITNRSFDLSAPVARLRREVGLDAFVIENQNAPQLLSEEARWVMLSADRERLARLEALAASVPSRRGRPRAPCFNAKL